MGQCLNQLSHPVRADFRLSCHAQTSKFGHVNTQRRHRLLGERVPEKPPGQKHDVKSWQLEGFRKMIKAGESTSTFLETHIEAPPRLLPPRAFALADCSAWSSSLSHSDARLCLLTQPQRQSPFLQQASWSPGAFVHCSIAQTKFIHFKSVLYLKIGIQQLLKNILLRHNAYIKEALAILVLLFIKMFSVRITKSMAPPFQYSQVEKAALILGRCDF